MKTKKYLHAFLLIVFLMGLVSCKKDLGNYTYTELNALSEIKNMPKVLVASYGKRIIFDPEVVFSKDADFDESKYEFEWSYIENLAISRIKTFSNTKKLDMIMQIEPSIYDAYYSITDKASGVKYTTRFSLHVVNEINEGWMMMTEANGRARADMLSLNTKNEFDVITDILSNVGSQLKLDGKPVMTYTYNTGLLIGPDSIRYGVYLGTDKTTTKVSRNNFKWTSTMDLKYEMFGNVSEDFYADVIQQQSNRAAFMIGKNKAYYFSGVQGIFYSVPISYISAEQKGFEVEPFIGGDYFMPGALAVFYDKTNRRFVKYSGTAPSCSVIPDPPAARRLFSFSTGMDLAYMRYISFNGGEIFSILKSGGKRYLARFNPNNNVQTYYAEITGTDIARAEFYAISPDYGYIFYAIGGKVYEYDMIYKSSKLMLDFGNRRVSYLNFYEFKNTRKYKDANKLMVGTYDPTISDGTEGFLNTYIVPGINADLIPDRSFSGFGRIKSLTYLEF
ncbi:MULTISPECIES: PKD-like family lipoprotein [unclassified Sphingobacterium]|uniref:PKD-like family lipoprotein n=1 Tax=unclassified Sphingobacterium TaxID=2609468 RepID=UPI0025F25FDF|nr:MULTISPECIES: PKD-like family lipoprotein [unclassified Sphingobacterium]